MKGGWLELAFGGVDGKLYILLCFPMAIGITTDAFDAILFKDSKAGGNRPCKKFRHISQNHSPSSILIRSFARNKTMLFQPCHIFLYGG